MKILEAAPGFAPRIFADNYDFDVVENGTFVEIGGSHGSVSIEVAKKQPHMHFVVQDLAEVVLEGRAHLPAELNLGDRLTFMEHNFFAEQPIKDADIYYGRLVFHNFSDKYSIFILRNLIPALKKGTRVVLSEFCLPQPGALHAEQERTMR
jgi:hypothetical protein